MKWPIRTKKMREAQAMTVWDSSTVRNAEKLKGHYRPQDIPAQEAVRRAIGVVHDCASKNARVCSAMPLRLMRRVESAGGVDTRRYAGKAIGTATRKGFASGTMGKDVASFMEAGGEVDEVMNHPVLDLLASPNDIMTGLHASWYSFYFREICGKSYEFAGYGGNGIEVLLPMPPQFVEMTYGDDGHDGYLYGRSESDIARLALDDVLMYKFQPSRFNPYDAEGPLAGVLAEADLIVQNIMHDLAFVNNGNRPDSMMAIEGVVTPDQLEELSRRINSKFGGASNGHKTYVASGKVSWTPFVWPEKELQSLAKVEHYEKRIRAAFGHTESMGDSNDSTYASALVGFSEQYMGAEIRPRLIADAAQKNRMLLEAFGLDPNAYCFVYDDPVKRDEATLADRTRLDVAAGLLTINEARAERNLDAVDDPGADVLRVNGQTFESLDAAPSESGVGGFDIPAMFRSTNVKRAKHATAMIFKGMKDDELPEWTPCGCGTKATDDVANDPLAERAMEIAKEPIETAFERIIRGMQNEIVMSVSSGAAVNLSNLILQAQQELREAMTDIVAIGVRDTIEMAGQNVPDMFNVVNTRALEFFDRHTMRVAEDIASTTETMIRSAIRRGLEEGLSIDEIADLMEGLPRYRAERIARTEIQTAVQGARYESLKELGVEEVEWMNAPGATAAHQMIASRSPLPMGEPFVKAGEVIKGEKFTRDIYHPPARPNCRCSIRAVFEEE